MIANKRPITLSTRFASAHASKGSSPPLGGVSVGGGEIGGLVSVGGGVEGEGLLEEPPPLPPPEEPVEDHCAV